MKKTIFFLLLVIILVACNQTKDFFAPTEQPYHLTFRDIRALPELPRDLSQIRHIEIRDTFPLATDSDYDYYEKGAKRYIKFDYAPSFFDYVDKVDMLTLSVPDGYSKINLNRILFDKDRIFVEYHIMASDSGCVAIYNRNGKLINRINPLDDLHHQQTVILNRAARELVVYEQPWLLRCFDYHGNYLRTIDFPHNSPIIINSRGTWMQQHGLDKIDCIVVFNDSLHPVAKVSDCEFTKSYRWAIDDDCLGIGLADTIWQILPDRCVARYVLSGNHTFPTSFYLNNDSTLDKKAYDEKLVPMDFYQFGNSRFLYTVFNRAFLMENGHLGFEVPIAHIYDAKTDRAMCYRVYFNQCNLVRKLRFSEWILANEYLTTPRILPDGTLVFPVESYYLKKEMAHQLEMQEAERDAIITKKDERFVRQLRLNDIVLFFVKLKKF